MRRIEDIAVGPPTDSSNSVDCLSFTKMVFLDGNQPPTCLIDNSICIPQLGICWSQRLGLTWCLAQGLLEHPLIPADDWLL